MSRSEDLSFLCVCVLTDRQTADHFTPAHARGNDIVPSFCKRCSNADVKNGDQRVVAHAHKPVQWVTAAAVRPARVPPQDNLISRCYTSAF